MRVIFHSLGNITSKYDGTKNQGLTGEYFLHIDSEKGEAKVYKQGKNDTRREQIDRSQARLKKWELLDCAQSILMDSRTRFCLRSRFEEKVTILHSKTSCRYSGLMVCGSVWHCPDVKLTTFTVNKFYSPSYPFNVMKNK